MCKSEGKNFGKCSLSELKVPCKNSGSLECTDADEAQIRKKNSRQCSLSELKVPCKKIETDWSKTKKTAW